MKLLLGPGEERRVPASCGTCRVVIGLRPGKSCRGEAVVLITQRQADGARRRGRPYCCVRRIANAWPVTPDAGGIAMIRLHRNRCGAALLATHGLAQQCAVRAWLAVDG